MKYTTLNENNVIQAYSQFKSSVKVSKLFNVSITPILRILKENNVKLVDYTQAARKYTVNHDYFNSINTKEKAYFLGLISADGYILTKRNYLELGLKESDKYILERLAKEMNSNRPLLFINKNKTNPNWSDGYRFSINSRQIVTNLIKMGIMQKKSLILKPTMIKFIPKNLIKYFVLGYFDGDGGFFRYIGIVGTKRMCLFFKRFFKTIGIKSYVRKTNKKDLKSNLHEVNFKAHNSLLKFYKEMYKDTDLFLVRKKEKLFNYLQLKNIF